MLFSSRRIADWLLLGLLVLNVAAFGVRLWFVIVSGSLAATTGYEEFCLYNIWKVLHALPLYESPVREPYLLTSYNAGFYYLYAAWVRLWQADGPSLVLCARLFSIVWALACWALSVRVLRRLAPDVPGARLWFWGLPFLVWFGTSYNAWGTVSARPDLAAGAFAVGGLLLCLHAEQRRTWWIWPVASLAFFAAWGCKQSVVWIFAGVALHLLLARRWRDLAGLALPFAGLAAFALLGSSAEYRFNLFTVPKIYRWMPGQIVGLLSQAVSLNLFFWLLGAMAVWRIFAGREPGPGAEARRMVAIAALPALLVGTVQLAFHGSSINNILEGFLLVSLLGAALWLRRRDEPSARLAPLGAGLLALMIPLPVVQLALAARGVPIAQVHRVSLGNLIKLNAAQRAVRGRYAEFIGRLPQPCWMRDAMYQLPWYANDNRYPAFPVDAQFMADAIKRQVIDESSIALLVRQRHFASLLLRPNDMLVRVARRVGYVEQPLPEDLGILPSEYGVNYPRPVLLIRAPLPAGEPAGAVPPAGR